MSNVYEEMKTLKEYIQIIEAELSRGRLSEREYAHLQKIVRQNVPPYSTKPTAFKGRQIFKELQEIQS